MLKFNIFNKLGKPEKNLSVNKKDGRADTRSINEMIAIFLIPNLFFKVKAKPAMNNMPTLIVLIKENIVNSVVSKISILSERFIFSKIGKYPKIDNKT